MLCLVNNNILVVDRNVPSSVLLGSTLALAAFALVTVVMRHTFDGTGLILLCSCLHFRVWVWFH